VTVTKFLILYRADVSAAEQMASASPEQQQAGMQAWMEWFGKAGDAVVDGGAPVSGDDKTITGYSLLQADSRQALNAILDSQRHCRRRRMSAKCAAGRPYRRSRSAVSRRQTRTLAASSPRSSMVASTGHVTAPGAIACPVPQPRCRTFALRLDPVRFVR